MWIPVAKVCVYLMTLVPVSWCDAFGNAEGSFIMQAYIISMLTKQIYVSSVKPSGTATCLVVNGLTLRECMK